MSHWITISLWLIFLWLPNPAAIKPVLSAAGNEGLKPSVALAGVNSGQLTDTSGGLIKLAVITCTEATIIPTAGSIEWYKADIPLIETIKATVDIALANCRFGENWE